MTDTITPDTQAQIAAIDRNTEALLILAEIFRAWGFGHKRTGDYPGHDIAAPESHGFSVLFDCEKY